ncbi:hypothetical protein C0Q70_17126 [Pomacea canaliculata]|uniref:Phosphatidic acid phosphatase type 2/haloperoxidase domain-containing protein n=2 Tax=Pomacea canaliculata TaxID=400727 RepID=A0A2T7NRS5_POMCA|nr:hypothetical protein C0Q70_17126 [Pomacea canaliculata]
MSTISEDQNYNNEPMAYEFPDGHAGSRPFSMSEASDFGSPWRRGHRQGILICVTFAIEFLLLIFVIIIEYFLRWTDAFPLRRQNFSCSDPEISCSSHDQQLMADFAFGANVPDSVIYVLSFCVPGFVVFIGELGLCTFSEGQQKSVRLVNRDCKVPQVGRRLLRFLGVFLFGIFALMLFVDVTKLLIGRLRPDFLHTCRVNVALCNTSLSSGLSLDDSACLNTDTTEIRAARTSFPSLTSALTSYAAIFLSVYVHGALRCHVVRILRAFLVLVFIMLSLLSGLAEVGRCHSHWTDVAVGFGVGVVMSTYLTVAVLNQFREHVTQTEMLHMLRLFMADHCMPFYEDKAHLARPSDPLTSMHIPRPHLPPGHIPGHLRRSESPKSQRRRNQSTFQRDLSQSVDYYRRHHPYLQGAAAHM